MGIYEQERVEGQDAVAMVTAIVLQTPLTVLNDLSDLISNDIVQKYFKGKTCGSTIFHDI
jgi:hypothetical protein